MLDLFVRQQMLNRDTIDFGRKMEQIQLAEPIQIEDEFDAWYFDHMRGIFDIWLLPNHPSTQFPLKWKLAANAQVFYEIHNTEDSNQQDGNFSQEQRNSDRPSTVSLERFIQGVCQQLNNGQAQKWINALREEDITTYPHLDNLKLSEWAEIKTLPLNARKLLKSFVNQEKQMVAEKKKKNKRNGMKMLILNIRHRFSLISLVDSFYYSVILKVSKDYAEIS